MAKAKFTPIGDKLLIRQDKASDRTPSGLIIIETEQKDPLTGTIVRRGPDCMKVLVEGLKVQFNEWAGVNVELDGEEFIVMAEEKVLGYFS